MKPFVKWAGGKKQIVDFILKKIKDSTSSASKNTFTFIEPFVGGGVVFLSLKNKKTIINDLNRELIITYRVIRNTPNELMDKLDSMLSFFNENKEGYFKSVREEDRNIEYLNYDNLHIAARTIFLNKTCYNGLYRVNSEGYFNTPLGRNNISSFYDRKNLLAISRYLQTISEENIMNGSYKSAMNYANFDDVVYVDPPYDYTESDGFTKYQKEGFFYEDLKELKEACDACLDREAYVIISNNDTQKVRKIFKNDGKHIYSFYYIEKVKTKRMINCVGSRRHTGQEIIIWGIPSGFPKIKDVNKMIEYVRIKNPKDITEIENLMTRFKVSKLRVTQILSTLRYFEIINNGNRFSTTGLALRRCRRHDSYRIMREIILKKSIFSSVYASDSVSKTGKMANEEIANLIFKEKPGMPKNIANKRAKIVRVFVDWCLEN